MNLSLRGLYSTIELIVSLVVKVKNANKKDQHLIGRKLIKWNDTFNLERFQTK